eukprot:m.362838 g.362838  ORF g.362838 m.362838 type:complete len:288 (+) comp20790_c0_seq3:202-1065(+)
MKRRLFHLVPVCLFHLVHVVGFPLRSCAPELRDVACVHHVTCCFGLIVYKALISLRERSQAQQDRARLQEQLRKLEADFLSYRQEVAAMPVSKIQEENTRLRTENLDLSRRLDSTTQGKQRYKLQWSKALAEISALKKQYMQTNKDVLRREQKELRHLRLQYLAREEHDILHGDRSELHAIRDELAHLRTAAANSAGAHATSHAPSHAHGGTAPAVVAGGGHIGSARSGGEPLTQATGHGTTNTKATNALRRMIEERSTLLRSGIYSAEDRIIKELDNKIRDLLPNH